MGHVHAHAEGIAVLGKITPEFEKILTPQALDFVVKLVRKFEGRRRDLMQARETRQVEFDAGSRPDFLPQTRHIREDSWSVAPAPRDLQDRRVEITGPVDRKMIINALNSGANVFMADFEDSCSPTWENIIQGQINLCDAVRGTISYRSTGGKQYKLSNRTATLMVRPRGWHLPEKHIQIDGQPVSGAIFDFALYFFHNIKELLARNTGAYFYLPKIESHLEARLWNDIFNLAEDEFQIPRGTIRATVLIETVLAAFEMEEILYELREHSAGLNAGRWDYIFSCIKKFRNDPEFILADRSHVTMTSPFMRAYALLLIKTCHKHGAHAMGGMAAQIPIKSDVAANEAALAKVRVDKDREASDGYDGTWVAHPNLVTVAKASFDAVMSAPNQIHKQRDDIKVKAADLLAFGPEKPITELGLRTNINVGLQYMGSWLAGVGCVPIYNLMEDAATAEIARSQIWQWIRSPKGVLEDGRKVTKELFRALLPQELAKIRQELGEKQFHEVGRYEEAAGIFDEITTNNDFVEFFTLPGYARLDQAV